MSAVGMSLGLLSSLRAIHKSGVVGKLKATFDRAEVVRWDESYGGWRWSVLVNHDLRYLRVLPKGCGGGPARIFLIPGEDPREYPNRVTTHRGPNGCHKNKATFLGQVLLTK